MSRGIAAVAALLAIGFVLGAGTIGLIWAVVT
jgi:hypothetical protein